MQQHPSGTCYAGLYPALVTDIVDPDRLARVQVRYPWLGDAGESVRAWATLLAPYADDDQGFVALPAVGTQVVVGFEAGDLRRPYVVGSCWNGREMMPVTPTRPNDRRMLKTRSGAVLEFDDAAGGARVTLSSGDGHRVVLDDGRRSLEVSHRDGSTLTFEASGAITLRANATVDVHACSLNVHAPTAVFDGAVTCTTMTASVAVVSPSYSPGAGNVW